MERGLSLHPNNESWPSPNTGEYKSPKKRRRTRNKRRGGEQTIAVPLEATPRKPARETTIWERPAAKKNAVAELTPAKHAAEHANPEAETPQKAVEETTMPEAVRQQKVTMPVPPASVEVQSERQLAGSPETAQSAAGQISHISEATQSIVHGEPTEYRRPYFWTETEVRQPDAADSLHDILPPVASNEVGTQKYEHTPESQPVPTAPYTMPDTVLEKAVNPNTAAGEVAATGAGGQTSGLTAANFLGRRRLRTAVKSHPMAHYNFEGSSLPPETSQEEAAMPVPAGSAMELPNEKVGQTGVDAVEAPVGSPQAVQSPEHPEHIGHVLVGAEGSAKQPQAPKELSPEQQMQREELLAMSETIRIDGVSVHEMFLANRIDEEGLRRVVTEYLRGGDVQKAVMSEVIRQQIKFERDPQLRGLSVKIPEAPKQRRVSRAKQRAKSLVDVQRTVERTEHFAGLAQRGVSKTSFYFRTNPRATTIASVVAIAIIYTLIFIIALR